MIQCSLVGSPSNCVDMGSPTGSEKGRSCESCEVALCCFSILIDSFAIMFSQDRSAMKNKQAHEDINANVGIMCSLKGCGCPDSACPQHIAQFCNSYALVLFTPGVISQTIS